MSVSQFDFGMKELYPEFPKERKFTTFKGWKALFHSKLSTSAIFDTISESDRTFVGIISTEDVDADKEIPDLDGFAKNIPQMLERGIPISLIHTDLIMGKIYEMELMTLAEVVKRYPDSIDELHIDMDSDTIEKTLATKVILGKGQIFNDYPELDDVIWESIQSGELAALSLRGVGKTISQVQNDSQGNVGNVMKNLRVCAVTLAPSGMQSSPRALILEKLQKLKQKMVAKKQTKQIKQPKSQNDKLSELLQHSYNKESKKMAENELETPPREDSSNVGEQIIESLNSLNTNIMALGEKIDRAIPTSKMDEDEEPGNLPVTPTKMGDDEHEDDKEKMKKPDNSKKDLIIIEGDKVTLTKARFDELYGQAFAKTSKTSIAKDVEDKLNALGIKKTSTPEAPIDANAKVAEPKGQETPKFNYDGFIEEYKKTNGREATVADIMHAAQEANGDNMLEY